MILSLAQPSFWMEGADMSARVDEGDGDEAKTTACCSDEDVAVIHFDHFFMVYQDDFGWFVVPVDGEN